MKNYIRLYLYLYLCFNLTFFSKIIISISPLKDDFSQEKLKISIIELDQEKDYLTAWQIMPELFNAFRDPNVDGIILNLDLFLKYGAAQSIYNLIKLYKSQYNKPIITYCEHKLINSSYLVACATDLIITSPTADIGAFGFWSEFKDQHEQDSELGIKYNYFSLGSYKLLGDPHVPFKLSWQNIVETRLNKLHEEFTEEIIKARPQIIDSKENWIQGQTIIAQDAFKQFNLIDGIGSQYQAIKNIFQLLNRNFDFNNFELKLIKIKDSGYFSKTKDNSDNNTNNLDDIRDTNNNLNFANKSNPDLHNILEDLNNIKPENNYATNITDTKIPKPSVAIIPINSIDSILTWELNDYLLKLFQDQRTLGLILAIDSYGGSSNITYTVFNQIKELKKYYNKPVVAYIDNQAFSAGYYIACSADYIIASPGALVGSVGVRLATIDKSKEDIKNKVNYTFIKSAKYLKQFSSHLSLSKYNKRELSNLLKKVYDNFVQDVIESRPLRAQESIFYWKDSQILIAQDALTYGLLDEIGSPIDAFGYIYKIYSQINRTNSNNLNNLNINNNFDKQIFNLDNFDLNFVKIPKKKSKKKNKNKSKIKSLPDYRKEF